MSATAVQGYRLADWIEGQERSLLREMITVAATPGTLSLAGGLPAPEHFPRQRYLRSLQRVIQEDANSLQYRPTFEPLKTHIVEIMALRGVDVSPKQVVLTTGAQQGIEIAAHLFLNPEDTLILERFLYTGLLQAIRPFRPRIQTVPTNLASGMSVDHLERLLRAGRRPAFLFVMGEGHNPLGITLSLEKRRRLIELACRYEVPIIEDDPYGLLTFDKAALPALRALSEEWVLYLGSFSKIIAPALRLGWMVLPPALIAQARMLKEAIDLECSALTQRAVSDLLDQDFFPGHLERVREDYKSRRDAMLEALDIWMPTRLRWTRPASGFFVWLELADGLDACRLLDQAIEEYRLAFVPGSAFAVNPGEGKSSLRLSYSTCNPETIREGISRLSKLLS